jgi:hypothetical protein
MTRFAVGLSYSDFSLVRMFGGPQNCSSVILRISLAIPTLLIFLVGTGVAQYSPGAGVPMFSAQAGSQYDSVDLANSNVFTTMPVRQKIGKIPFSASLTGNYGAYIWTDSAGNKNWGVSSVTPGSFVNTFGLSVPALSTSLLYYVSSGLCNGQTDAIYSQFAIADARAAPHIPCPVR